MKVMPYRRFLMMTAAFIVSMAGMYARPSGSIGGCFSLNGTGVSFHREMNGYTFWQIDLEVDYSHAVFRERSCPGVILRYGYNKVFKECRKETGTLRFYGGPGVMFGYSMSNFNDRRGHVGGLTGTLGLEYVFDMPVTLSLSITPCLGFHLSRPGDSYSMDLYLDGITYALLPTIGIRYEF